MFGARISSPVLVGREGPLGVLEAALAEARAGTPRFVILSGEAGIGKSRLTEEFTSRARNAGARIVVGRCLDVGEGAIGYAALVEAIRSAVDGMSGTNLRRVAPSAVAELGRLVPGLSPAAPPVEPEPEARQILLFEAILELLKVIGREAPVVLVLEDIHWADPATREFVGFLVRRAAGRRLVTVLTHRVEPTDAVPASAALLEIAERAPTVTRLDLQPLEADEVASLATAITGGPPDPGALRQLVDRSDGNPLHVEELLAAGGAGAQPPRRLIELLLRRVRGLSAQARRLVELAAVGGERFEDELLASVYGRSDGEFLAAVREAVAGGVLVPRGDGYGFRHALVREVVESALLPPERSTAHVAWAEELERRTRRDLVTLAARARHWAGARRPVEATAAAFEAAELARTVGAFGEASHQYGLVIDLWDEVDDVEERIGATLVDVLERSGSSAHLAGIDELSRDRLARAVEEIDAAREPVRAARLHMRLGERLRYLGQVDPSIEHYEAALALVPDDPPCVGLAEVLASYAQTCMLAGRDERARHLAERSLQVATAVGPDAAAPEAHALSILGAVIGLEDPVRARSLQGRAIELATDIGHPYHACRGYLNLSAMQTLEGDLEGSVASARRGLRIALDHGLEDSWGVWLRGNLSESLFDLGRWDEAEEVNAALARSPLSGELRYVQAASGATQAIARGELDEAERLLRSIDGPVTEFANLVQTYFPAWAELAYWRRRPTILSDIATEAIAAFTEPAEARWAAAQFLSWSFATIADGPRADADIVPELRRDLDDLVAGSGDAPAYFRPWIAMAEAEAARIEDPAVEAWERALARWERSGMPYPLGYARFRAAEARLISGGDRNVAVSHLQAAHRTSVELGADHLTDSIEALARRVRIRLEREAPGGSGDTPIPAGLTDREVQVLELLASGRTNREIGEVLFVTEKTVEGHVTRILTKLDAGNRVEAARIAYGLGIGT